MARTGDDAGVLHPDAEFEEGEAGGSKATPTKELGITPHDRMTGGASPFMEELGLLLDGDDTDDPMALPTQRTKTLLRGHWIAWLQATTPWAPPACAPAPPIHQLTTLPSTPTVRR